MSVGEDDEDEDSELEAADLAGAVISSVEIPQLTHYEADTEGVCVSPCVCYRRRGRDGGTG